MKGGPASMTLAKKLLKSDYKIPSRRRKTGRRNLCWLLLNILILSDVKNGQPVVHVQLNGRNSQLVRTPPKSPLLGLTLCTTHIYLHKQ